MWLEPNRLRFSLLSECSGPGILMPIDKYQLKILVPADGEGDAIMLTDSHAGQLVPIAKGEHFDGMFISGVEIEVDTTTAFSSTSVQRPTLSAIVHPDGVAFSTVPDHRNFMGRHSLTPWTGKVPTQSASHLAFTSWNAFIMRGDEKIVLHEHRGQRVSE